MGGGNTRASTTRRQGKVRVITPVSRPPASRCGNGKWQWQRQWQMRFLFPGRIAYPLWHPLAVATVPTVRRGLSYTIAPPCPGDASSGHRCCSSQTGWAPGVISYPDSHSQLPSAQCSCPPHSTPAHGSTTSHAPPEYPRSHWQLPPAQLPCSPQLTPKHGLAALELQSAKARSNGSVGSDDVQVVYSRS